MLRKSKIYGAFLCLQWKGFQQSYPAFRREQGSVINPPERSGYDGPPPVNLCRRPFITRSKESGAHSSAGRHLWQICRSFCLLYRHLSLLLSVFFLHSFSWQFVKIRVTRSQRIANHDKLVCVCFVWVDFFVCIVFRCTSVNEGHGCYYYQLGTDKKAENIAVHSTISHSLTLSFSPTLTLTLASSLCLSRHFHTPVAFISSRADKLSESGKLKMFIRCVRIYLLICTVKY